MPRVFSGIQPSGSLHVGNYLGAVRQWARTQHQDALYCVVDLHALTLDIDPADLRRRTIDTAIGLIASGLDPDVCTLFLQSHVPEHTELSWLLECTASYGELRRMTQFKEKGAGQESVRASLLTYPVLMAADILLYDTSLVPVGDDQRQHLELARDLAIRFNGRYGETFVVPEAQVPAVGSRVMDLQEPGRKMSKSAGSDLGRISITDPPEEISRKVRRAVTDTEGTVRYDPADKPGVSNLLELLAAVSGERPEVLARRYTTYSALKKDVADGLVELLAPLRARVRELSRDPGEVAAILEKGAARARALAEPTLSRARAAVGLTPR
jgi:tryptophanyl-tRNA synthetase